MAGTITPPRPSIPPGSRPAASTPPSSRPPARPGSWTVDRTLPATLALTALTLSVALGFARLFSDWAFVGPAILATLAGHAVAWWCRRNRLAAGVSAIATLGAVALVAAWTVLGHTTAYGIPIPFTVRSGLTALASARDSFAVVKAPAAALPGFVLATVLALGITAFMADWAAFRLQATFEALIPTFTLFLFTAALGNARYRTGAVAIFVAAVLTFLVVHGLARSNRAGAWFGGRPGNGPRSLVVYAAALGAAAIVTGLVVGPHIPSATDPPLLHYKNRAPAGPSTRATVSPLVDIRGRLVDQSGTEVFTVESPTKAYWRLTSLDTFDGSIWSSNDTYRPTRGTIATDEPLRSDLPIKVVEQKFSVRDLVSIWLPAAFRPDRIRELRDVSYNRDTASLITPSDTTDGLIYTVRSDIPQLTPELLATAQPTAPQAVIDRYLTLPPVSDRVKAEARRITAAARTPYEKAKALQDYFHRGFKYDLNARPGHNSRALENFLLSTKTGYCEQFAGSYAVLARLVDLPTRVAVGFTPGELQDDGLYHVRDEHAHAWPEVYLHGFGWVAFEPTPGRGAPGNEPYTGVPANQDTSGDATSPSTTPSTATTIAGDETPVTSAPSFDPNAAAANAKKDNGIPGFFKFLLAVVGLAAGWGIVVPSLHVLRRRSRHADPAPASQVLAAWEDTAELLAAAGVGRRAAETMSEYAGRAARSAGLGADPARALRLLAGDAAVAAYADLDVPAELHLRADQSAALVKAAVLDQVSTTERLRWWLDPRLLVGRSSQ
jgi:transglutaminase-like putative cysteine protease